MLDKKRLWKTVVDLLNTFTKWWIRILKQVCNSGQSNPTQPFYPFVSTPHGQGNPECLFHQEAVLVTRRAERCGVVYPVEIWPACSTGFPIRPLRSAGAQHLRFVRPMKSLTPAILVSIMARGSFKSKLIFFVASTHLGPLSWTLAWSKQSSLRPLSSGLVPPRDGLTHELFDRGLRFLLRKERGLIFLIAASNKSQELFIIDYACSSN